MEVSPHVAGEKRQQGSAGAESQESRADYQIGEMVIVGNGKSPYENDLESEHRKRKQEDRTGQPARHPGSAVRRFDRSRHRNKPDGHELPGRNAFVLVLLDYH